MEGKVQVQTSEGVIGWVDKLTLPVGGSELVQVTVNGAQLHVVYGEGREEDRSTVSGSADRVTRGNDGPTLVLEGNASLQCHRKGMKAESSADRITVNLTTGQIVSDVGPQAAGSTSAKPPAPRP